MRPIGIWAKCNRCSKRVNGFYNVMQGRMKQIKANPIQWEFTCKKCLEKEQ